MFINIIETILSFANTIYSFIEQIVTTIIDAFSWIFVNILPILKNVIDWIITAFESIAHFFGG